MPWSTMEICRYKKRYIGYVALYVPQLCVIFSADHRWHRYGLTHIRSHAASYSCCFRCYVHFFKCASWVMFSVATIAASRWTNWCLRCCWVSPRGALREAPVVRLDSAPIAPGGSVSGSMACCCRIVRKMMTKRSGKCWRLSSELQVKMEWVNANLHVQFKLNPAVYSRRGFQRSRDFSKLVWCCLFVYRVTSSWTTADICCLIDLKRSFFDGKDVWWCLSHDIAGIVHESHANYQVIMYC